MGEADNSIEVSILCVTYNHGPYIARALDSFLAQKVDFDIEIVVADDCSTDETAEIVYGYVQRHPEIIKFLPNKRNVGPLKNGRRAVEAARGRFYAICDGDDFFLQDNKIKNSRDCMLKDESLSMLFSPALAVNERTGKKKIICEYSKKKASQIDLDWVFRSGGGFFPTCTSFYRSSKFQDLPDWFYDHSAGDYAWAIVAAMRGNIGYIDQVSACYWINPNSWSHAATQNDSVRGREARLRNSKNLKFISQLFHSDVVDLEKFKFLVALERYRLCSALVDLRRYCEALGEARHIGFSRRYEIGIWMRLVIRTLFKIIR